MPIPVKDFASLSRAAVKEAMLVVKDYQLDRLILDEAAEVKAADNTLVTYADWLSENIMQSNLALTPFASLYRVFEERGVEGELTRYWVGGDGIDGTGAFVYGLPTSTIILYLYDSLEKKVVACTIGEPISGHVWQFCEGSDPVAAWWDTYRDDPVAYPMQVWSGTLNSGSAVFLDVAHGFQRSGRQILTNAALAHLTERLGGRHKLLIPGSNGLIQALVAMGNERVGGGITTALGGPQDAAGVSLVLAAGGYATAYSVSADRLVTQQNPRDPFSFDCAAYGNSVETVAHLDSLLRAALTM